MDETVLLGHGSGGSMMKRIIDEVFFEAYAGEELRVGDDAARLEAPEGERVAFSTDSFVVTPQSGRRYRALGRVRYGERCCNQRCRSAVLELRVHP